MIGVLESRKTVSVSPYAYILDRYSLENVYYACSFRQLRWDANFAARQYTLDGSSFQDIPFVNGYADMAAITSFANGAATTYELYSQGMNTLYYVNPTPSQRPRLTDASGNIYVDAFGKINPLHLSTTHLDLASAYDDRFSRVYFTVQTAGTTAGAMYFPGLNSQYAGFYQSGNTTSSTWVESASPDFTYKVNGQSYPRNVQRATLFSAMNNRQNQMVGNGIVGVALNKTRYIWSTTIPVVPRQQEYIMMQKTTLGSVRVITDEQILEIENDQIEFYQIAV